MTFSIDKPLENTNTNMKGGQSTEKEIDATISKMEKIIKKKKKGNYKNVDLLENIYEDNDDKKEGGILESLKDFEEELNSLNDSLKELSQFSQEGFDNNVLFDSKLYDYKKDYENIVTPSSILPVSSSSSGNTNTISNTNINKPAGYISKQNRLGLLEKWFGTIPYKKYYEKWIGKPLVQNGSKNGKTKCKTASAAKYIDEGISYARCIINIPSLLFWFVAAYMYDSFDRDSKNPAKNGDDVILVATQMWHVFIIPLIVFITYNWYYLMFMVDSKGAPLKDPFPENVMNIVERNFFTKLFKSLVKPMILADVFLRWTVQYLWRSIATTFKIIKF